MSPRSEEYMEMAREALQAARLALSEHLYADAVSRAYYAMLDAARAALSERDLYAKTHRGLWSLFSESFVKSGEVDGAWSGRAEKARNLREGGDYGAKRPAPEAATEVVQWAGEFVAEIERLFA